MTEVDSQRSYDDFPESDVSTVLQVPLLWGPDLVVGPVATGARTHRRSTGRHRSTPVRAPHLLDRFDRFDRWVDHPMVHTAGVGLVSASLVLALFGALLLALSLWLP